MLSGSSWASTELAVLISQRRFLEFTQRLLCIVCGWYWFGASGAALVTLWFATKPGPEPITAERFLAALNTRETGFIHLTRWRLLLIHPHWGRLEIFSDEVDAHAWAHLKRRCVGQPATGRNTSI